MKKRKKSPSATDVIITKHAVERARERLSFSGKALVRMARKAFYEGIRLQELKKTAFPVLVLCQRVNNLRIYGEVVYLFCDNVLITLYQVPKSLKKMIRLD